MTRVGKLSAGCIGLACCVAAFGQNAPIADELTGLPLSKPVPRIEAASSGLLGVAEYEFEAAPPARSDGPDPLAATTPAIIPEPHSLVLAALGASMALRNRRR